MTRRRKVRTAAGAVGRARVAAPAAQLLGLLLWDVLLPALLAAAALLGLGRARERVWVECARK